MNIAIFILILMILAHLLADYTLQGWLAQAKARKYWENSPKKNRYDHMAALICHGVMWAILVGLPPIMATLLWGVGTADLLWLFYLFVPANAFAHCCIDHCKATCGAINLWQDQLLHLAQILIWWGSWIGICQVLA